MIRELIRCLLVNIPILLVVLLPANGGGKGQMLYSCKVLCALALLIELEINALHLAGQHPWAQRELSFTLVMPPSGIP